MCLADYVMFKGKEVRVCTQNICARVVLVDQAALL